MELKLIAVTQTYFSKFQTKIIPTTIEFFVLALLTLSFFTFPTPKAINLDTSWQQTLAEAYLHNWQAGVDYVFTYGPLGYFGLKNPAYYGSIFQLAIWTWLGISLIAAWIFLMWAKQLPTRLKQIAFLLLLGIIVSEVSRFADPFFTLLIVCSTLLFISPSSCFNSPIRYLLGLQGLLLIFTLLSLVKFSYFLLIVICVGILTFNFGLRCSFKKALLFPIYFIILLIVTWIILGQNWQNLPIFLSRSWELAHYYSEAMSYPINPDRFILGLATLFSLGLLMWIAFLGTPNRIAQFISSLLILAGLFISWKSSFVRYEEFIHGVMFFCFALLTPFLIPFSSLRIVRPFLLHLIFLLPIGLALMGIFSITYSHGYQPTTFLKITADKLLDNIKVLTAWEDYKNHYEQVIAIELKTQHALPKIQSHLNQATVDILPAQQGVLFLNNLSYRPRPLFQDYLAYSSTLARLNETFYTNPATAPDYVLFDLEPLDTRFPMSQDAGIINRLLWDYRPLFIEKTWLLLQHQPRQSSDAETNLVNLFAKEIKFGESVDLRDFNSMSLWATPDFKPSWLGRLASLLVQLPPTFLEIVTTNGQHLRYRILSSLSDTVFLLNPLLKDQGTWINWYLGKTPLQVAQLKIVTQSAWMSSLFDPKIVLTIKENSLTPYPIEEGHKRQLLADLLRQALDSVPDYLTAFQLFPENKIPGQKAKRALLVMESPGELRFKIGTGSYSLKGDLGILRTMGTNSTLNYTAIGQFKATFVNQQGQEFLIFDRILTLSKSRESFEFKFNVGEVGEIVLRSFSSENSVRPFWQGIAVQLESGLGSE